MGATSKDFASLAEAPLPSEPIRLLFPGNIGVPKGSALIRQLRDADTAGRLEFHILGRADAELQGERIIRHGPYRREDLTTLVGEIRPHFGGIFSIWPETYCHTLTELWACGVPVIALDFGAVGERIRQSGGGWLLRRTDIETMLAEILRITADGASHRARVGEVLDWQAGEGGSRSIARMAKDYAALYDRVWSRARAFAPPVASAVSAAYPPFRNGASSPSSSLSPFM